MSNLTIVMYHYVRPIKNSEYPLIKGLELDGFYRQLDYLQEHYSVISTNEIINSIKGKSKLPNNSCWLTFDDGYKDHFEYVMPELIKRNICGAFFPPRIAIQNDVLLDVNSIHHILACCKNIPDLVNRVNTLSRFGGISQAKLDQYWIDFAVANRWDNKNIIYVKRMLQHILPEDMRNEIVSVLFEEYVGVSQANFSKELYMSISDVKSMINKGMFIGSHGSRHCWLNKISDIHQKEDIVESLSFLEEVGAPTEDWIMCYPYGGYNSETLQLLKKFGALIGITTEARVANILKDDALTLPRMNTNDFPQ